jgi:hypothetical protein
MNSLSFVPKIKNENVSFGPKIKNKNVGFGLRQDTIVGILP